MAGTNVGPEDDPVIEIRSPTEAHSVCLVAELRNKGDDIWLTWNQKLKRRVETSRARKCPATVGCPTTLASVTDTRQVGCRC
jgi:hypothetical protein